MSALLTTQDRILIEAQVGNEGPNVGVAYLFWFFLGIFSGHRFYIGKPRTAILQIITVFVLIGLVWILIDAFRIPGMVRRRQAEVRERLTRQAVADLSAQAAPVAALPSI